MRPTTPKALAASGALALLLAACGGTAEEISTDTTDGSPTEETTTTDASSTTVDAGTTTTDGAPIEDGAAALAAAASSAEDLTSGRFTMTMDMTEIPGVGDVSFTIEGAFNDEGQTSISMDMGAFMEALADAAPDSEEDPFGGLMEGMFDEPIEVVVDGETTYVKMGFLASMMGIDTEWISSPTEEGSDVTGFGAGAMGSPSDFIEVLEGAGSEVEELGTDEVNDVEATGYQVEIDLEAAATEGGADVDELFGMTDGDDLEGVLVPMEVWLSEDGFPVRIAMELDGELMASFDPTGEMEGGSMTLTIDFLDLGEPVEIEIPDPSDVTSEDELDESSLFGGLDEEPGGEL